MRRLIDLPENVKSIYMKTAIQKGYMEDEDFNNAYELIRESGFMQKRVT